MFQYESSFFMIDGILFDGICVNTGAHGLIITGLDWKRVVFIKIMA
jgi:hypothetical protein